MSIWPHLAHQTFRFRTSLLIFIIRAEIPPIVWSRATKPWEDRNVGLRTSRRKAFLLSFMQADLPGLVGRRASELHIFCERSKPVWWRKWRKHLLLVTLTQYLSSVGIGSSRSCVWWIRSHHCCWICNICSTCTLICYDCSRQIMENHFLPKKNLISAVFWLETTYLTKLSQYR